MRMIKNNKKKQFLKKKKNIRKLIIICRLLQLVESNKSFLIQLKKKFSGDRKKIN